MCSNRIRFCQIEINNTLAKAYIYDIFNALQKDRCHAILLKAHLHCSITPDALTAEALTRCCMFVFLFCPLLSFDRVFVSSYLWWNDIFSRENCKVRSANTTIYNCMNNLFRALAENWINREQFSSPFAVIHNRVWTVNNTYWLTEWLTLTCIHFTLSVVEYSMSVWKTTMKLCTRKYKFYGKFFQQFSPFIPSMRKFTSDLLNLYVTMTKNASSRASIHSHNLLLEIDTFLHFIGLISFLVQNLFNAWLLQNSYLKFSTNKGNVEAIWDCRNQGLLSHILRKREKERNEPFSLQKGALKLNIC